MVENSEVFAEHYKDILELKKRVLELEKEFEAVKECHFYDGCKRTK